MYSMTLFLLSSLLLNPIGETYDCPKQPSGINSNSMSSFFIAFDLNPKIRNCNYPILRGLEVKQLDVKTCLSYRQQLNSALQHALMMLHTYTCYHIRLSVLKTNGLKFR